MLAEAGVEVVGENRAQDLEAKHAAYGDAFRWHFIGHLQSNKVKAVNRHLRARALARLATRPRAGSRCRRSCEVNLAGEESKAGVAPERARAATCGATRRARAHRRCRPLADDPEASRPWFRRLRELAAEHRLGRALDGNDVRTTGSPRRKARRYVRVGAVLFVRPAVKGALRSRRHEPRRPLGPDARLFRDRRRERGAVRPRERYTAEERISKRGIANGPTSAFYAAVALAESTTTGRSPEAERRPPAGRRGGRAADARTSRPSRTRTPSAFISSSRAASTTRSRSQTSSRQGIPVILNLQSADTELSKRLIDFGSGLTYALSGGMQRVADKVFLLTPRNVEVSAEQRAQLLERGGFYNQA